MTENTHKQISWDSITCLIVDDDKFSRTFTKTALYQIGIKNVKEASNTKEATEQLNAFKIDVILMDQQMPEQTGLTLAIIWLGSYLMSKNVIDYPTVSVFAEYAGQPPSPFIDAVHRSIQVRVRSKDSTEARKKAVQLYKAFSNTTEERRIDFTDELWGQVYVRQPPYKINQDRSERTIYGFNLGITTNIID